MPILSVSEADFAEGLVIYPNPASDVIQVKSSTEAIHSISITDILGKTIYSEANIDTQLKSIDVSGFSEGLYFVTLNNQVTKKIIKR